MTTYNTYPAVDDTTHQFPPLVRAGIAASPEILAHTANVSNPHLVTKAQVGLGSVDNTADTAKPVSTAQQAALDLKAPLASPAFTGTPTGITATHVGLPNVNNTSDANKPVSTAQQTALDLQSRGQCAEVVTAGSLTGIAGTLVMVDYLPSISLVSGRRYRVRYKFTSVSAGANEALGVNLVKSITSDVTSAGTSVEDTATLWTAPLVSSGSTHQIEFDWKAPTTETVNLKMTLQRAVGASTIDISVRRLTVTDEGAQF